MKIRLKTNTNTPVDVTGIGVVEPGKAVEVEDALAQQLIAQGGWEAVKGGAARTAAAESAKPSEE